MCGGDGEEWEGKTATGGLFEQKNISGGSSIIPAPYRSPLKTAHADPE